MGRIEKSVAEKPLNEYNTGTSPQKSPPKDSQSPNVESLKMTVKAR